MKRVLFTMGCGDACPVTPKDRTIARDIENPKGSSIQECGRIRNVIESKVVKLMGEMDGERDA